VERVGTSLGLYIIPPLAARISYRRLVVRAGTSKGCTISQYGCSTFGGISYRGPVRRRIILYYDNDDDDYDSNHVDDDKSRCKKNQRFSDFSTTCEK
jgi:hypothetical protein